MTDLEKAIVMAYTGVCMLSGDKLKEYYDYCSGLLEHPAFTHEIYTNKITELAKNDFLNLCKHTTPDWHDLKTDPNDLPWLGQRVEVVLADKETGEIENHYFTQYGVGNPFGGSLMEIWAPPYQYCFYDHEIVAWREIEKYGGNDNE